MRWFRSFTVVVTTFALVGLLFVSGCKKKTKGDGEGDGDDPAPVKEAPKPPVEIKEFTTLKGRVVYDGTPPGRDSLKDQVNGNKTDAPHCLMDPTEDSFMSSAWKVGKDNGVANVVIFIEPPKGKVFGKVPDDKKPFDKDTVLVDQPFCAFEPFVSVVHPGQELVVQNSAPFTHNTNYSGPGNAGDNKVLPGLVPGKEPSKFSTPLKATLTGPVKLTCQAHAWMQGYVWPADTPYATTTDKDGNFEIKNAPADTEVRLLVWQDQLGFVPSEGGKDGKTLTLKKGTDTLPDIKIKK